MSKSKFTAAPAMAMTAVSMVLTLAVVVMWLGEVMSPWVALVVGLGMDGAWLATLSYERRLAAQGDHSAAVTAFGWAFGALATAVLVFHALNEGEHMAAWLAVAWLPLAAKALWLIHGLWERTALTPRAIRRIQEIQQEARDGAAIARAELRSRATSEQTRLVSVTEAGARVARVQARTARTLRDAWGALDAAAQDTGADNALTCVTERVTPASHPHWDLPTWGPTMPAIARPAERPAAPAETGLSDDELDAIVIELRHSETPPLSYREMSTRFRAAGHRAPEQRLRESWRRVTAPADAS
ncbi:protein spdB [Streptomyces harbinensis]|uniref:protein spdB n=1 Tax=Streptomyces harbinensis TaxID=1176198 RepID=UPI00371833DE